MIRTDSFDDLHEFLTSVSFMCTVNVSRGKVAIASKLRSHDAPSSTIAFTGTSSSVQVSAALAAHRKLGAECHSLRRNASRMQLRMSASLYWPVLASMIPVCTS